MVHLGVGSAGLRVGELPHHRGEFIQLTGLADVAADRARDQFQIHTAASLG